MFRLKFADHVLGGIVVALLAASPLTWAHHSYAMFDRNSTVALKGVVRTWEFSNPHSTLWLYVDDAKGKPELWGFESLSPGALTRMGWKKTTVKPGDHIAVVINPLKDGRRGGNLVAVTFANGVTRNFGTLPQVAPNKGPEGPSNEPREGEKR